MDDEQQLEWLEIWDERSSSSSESPDANHEDFDHRTLLGCEASHPELPENTGSWEALFDDDPLACDEPEVQHEVASLASTDDFRESERARMKMASPAPVDNIDQLKFDSRAWESLLRDSLAPRLKTRAKISLGNWLHGSSV